MGNHDLARGVCRMMPIMPERLSADAALSRQRLTEQNSFDMNVDDSDPRPNNVAIALRRPKTPRRVLALACAALLLLATTSHPATRAGLVDAGSRARLLLPWLATPAHRGLRTRVGPRRFPNLYQGCTAGDFIEAIGRARIRPTGRSRKAGYAPSDPQNPDAIDWRSFELSFDIDGCPAPHIFDSSEACDLLSAFGGVLVRGDSIMRQFFQGLATTTTNSLDLSYDKTNCKAGALFTNAKYCKYHSIYDSADFAHACSSDPHLVYETCWVYNDDISPFLHDGRSAASLERGKEGLLQRYDDFVLASPRRAYSPVIVEATGIHYQWNTTFLREMHIVPHLVHTADSLPRPLSFVAGYTAPRNPEGHQHSPSNARAFNARTDKLLDELQSDALSDGRMVQVDYFNMTLGAQGYDTLHSNFQVAAERAQVLLNVLDIAWSDIV